MKYYYIKDDFTKDVLLFATRKALQQTLKTYAELKDIGIDINIKVGRCTAHYNYNGGVK